jgi:dihydroorotate dehydrogenase (fumarate)
MDLSTTYMGLHLKNPLVASASPLSRSVDTVRRMEEAGIAAVVMYSLFEEQIERENQLLDHYLTRGGESFAEALSYFPSPDAFNNADAEEYLNHLSALKKNTNIPIIGSLNGVSSGGWMSYAKRMQDAGADAIELNVYYIPTDPSISADDVENMYIENIKTVKASVSIPVAIKLAPYFTSFAGVARKLSEAGADGLVLFNRFYQPDIDLETLDVTPNLIFSTRYEARLPLRWIAILYGNVKASLAATSGIHEAEDVLKMLMSGADVTMMASVLIKEGINKIAVILSNMKKWMETHDYESVSQMKGSMSCRSVAEPAAYERANYMKTLQSI